MLSEINDDFLEKEKQLQRGEKTLEEFECLMCGQIVYDYEINTCKDCDARVCHDCINDGKCENCQDDTD